MALGRGEGASCTAHAVHTFLGGESTVRSPFLPPLHPSPLATTQAVAGWSADGRVLAGEAQNLAEEYASRFGERISPNTIATQVAGQVHLCTCYTSYRPYGCSMLLAGYNDIAKEAELYCIEPSGVKLVRAPSPRLCLLSCCCVDHSRSRRARCVFFSSLLAALFWLRDWQGRPRGKNRH